MILVIGKGSTKFVKTHLLIRYDIHMYTYLIIYIYTNMYICTHIHICIHTYEYIYIYNIYGG